MRKKHNHFFLFFIVFAIVFSVIPSSVFATSLHKEDEVWTDDEKPKQETSSFPVKDGLGKEIGNILLTTPYSIHEPYDYSFTLYRKDKEAGLIHVSAGTPFSKELEVWKEIDPNITVQHHVLPQINDFDTICIQMGENKYYYIDLGNGFIDVAPTLPSDQDAFEVVAKGLSMKEKMGEATTQEEEITEEDRAMGEKNTSYRVYEDSTQTSPVKKPQKSIIDKILDFFEKILKNL